MTLFITLAILAVPLTMLLALLTFLVYSTEDASISLSPVKTNRYRARKTSRH